METQAYHREMLALYNSGAGLAVLMQHYGRSRSGTYCRLRKTAAQAGIALRPALPSQPQKLWRDMDIVQKYQDGFTHEELAVRFGLHPTTIRDIIKRTAKRLVVQLRPPRRHRLVLSCSTLAKLDSRAVSVRQLMAQLGWSHAAIGRAYKRQTGRTLSERRYP